MTSARGGTVRIGDLAQRTGCNIETIRYYERIGLLAAPPRSVGGYRLYGAADLQRVTFIRRARGLGFSVKEVRALLALAAVGERDTCERVRAIAAHHLAEVRARIADLRAMEHVLADAVARCAAGELPGCPIIGALSQTRQSGPDAE
jgi:MerR family transcriptional regulator, mercuric resistance operon regulatory protein